MSISNVFQFIFGFILGIGVLSGSLAGVAFIVFTQMAAPPPKPEFTQEKEEVVETTKKVETQEVIETQTPATSEVEPTPAPKEELEPGAYRAIVSWSEGLSLRDRPGLESQRIGGIAYNAEIIILQDSEDKKWQKVRIPDSQQEGWIKTGNVTKIEEQNSQ
jgi:Bacterial SH3 domain